MAIGEIIGILFLFGVLLAFVARAYRANLCPECGGFRTVETVSVKKTPLDTDSDALEIICDLISDSRSYHKSSWVEWVDRCKACGYKIECKDVIRHH
jgi:hypothetical protein